MGFIPKDLVLVGVGQLGTLFGEGALKAGRRVTPLRRDSDIERCLDDVAADAPVLIAVGERDLRGAVEGVPQARREHVVLVQNELFPKVWKSLGLVEPTVAVVWLSKKKDQPVVVGGPTEVYGRHADVVAQLHTALELPCVGLPSPEARDLALASKYAFIVAINALGLEHDLSLGQWLERDRTRVLAVAEDARKLAEAQLGRSVDGRRVVRRVIEAMEALPAYPARGRTAEERLARARDFAREHRLSLPALLGA